MFFQKDMWQWFGEHFGQHIMSGDVDNTKDVIFVNV
jgi:hypothetical protein